MRYTITTIESALYGLLLNFNVCRYHSIDAGFELGLLYSYLLNGTSDYRQVGTYIVFFFNDTVSVNVGIYT